MTAKPVRFAVYHRLARDPADKDPHDTARSTARIRALAQNLGRGLEPYLEPDPAPRRFAFYSRVAAAHPDHKAMRAHEFQRARCQCALIAVGGTITASYVDSGIPSNLPLPERPAGARLLTANGFDAVVTADIARLGHGHKALAQARYPVLLADLGVIIEPDGWDDPLIRILAGSTYTR